LGRIQLIPNERGNKSFDGIRASPGFIRKKDQCCIHGVSMSSTAECAECNREVEEE
jgi:hypothetical protein